MKLIQEEVQVQVDAMGFLYYLRWRNRLYLVVQVLEEWRYDGDWWLSPELSGAQRRYCRARVTRVKRIDANSPKDESGYRESCCMELYEEAGQWVLSRVLD